MPSQKLSYVYGAVSAPPARLRNISRVKRSQGRVSVASSVVAGAGGIRSSPAFQHQHGFTDASRSQGHHQPIGPCHARVPNATAAGAGEEARGIGVGASNRAGADGNGHDHGGDE